jgi:hypothetical protein
MTIIKGLDGWIKVRISGSADFINTRFVSQWQATLNTNQVDQGPFLNDDGKIYSFTTSKRISGSFDVTLPTNRTDIHTALINSANSGYDVGLRLISKGGYTWEIPSGIVTGYSVTNSAGDAVTMSFDFTDNGGFTVSNSTTTSSANEPYS